MVGGEAPGKTEDGGDDGDGLVGLEDGQLALHAHLDQPDLNLVLGHVVNETWQEEIELNSGLEGGLQADLHHPGRRVQHLARLQLLLSSDPLWTLRKVVLAIVVVLYEEHRERPKHDTAEEGDGVEDELEVALDQVEHSWTAGHILNYVGSLGDEGIVVLGGEELIDEEGPGDEDEEEGVAELCMTVHCHREALQLDVAPVRPFVHAVLLKMFRRQSHSWKRRLNYFPLPVLLHILSSCAIQRQQISAKIIQI